MFTESVFKLVCGGVLRNESGTIVAPDSNSDGRYDDNIQLFHTFLFDSQNYHPEVLWMTR